MPSILKHPVADYQETNTRLPLVIVGDEWGLHPTSVQHLARRLARENPVLYANALYHRRLRWTVNDARRVWGKLRQWLLPNGNGQVEGLSNLHVYSQPVIPFRPIGPVRRWNRNLLVRGLRRQMRLHKIEAPVLFVALPFGAEAVGALGESLLVYYVIDQYSALPAVYADYVEDLERILLSEADLVFVTSKELQREKNGRKAPALLLPHGVDFDHFHSATDPPGPGPEELRHLSRPILGFHGVLAPWVDTDILEQVCRAFPRASVILIGPEWIDFPMPKGLLNLFKLGPRSYAELPRYAAQFDVGLIPFRRDRLTAYVNPLKLLEYLALGLPVVTTPLPDLDRFGDLVLQGSSPDEFVDQVKSALADRSPERRRQRFALAAGESWEARVNTLQHHVESALRQKRIP